MPKGIYKRKSSEERFWPKVRIPFYDDGCWVWIGTKVRNGYGEVWIGKKRTKAHRFSYSLYHPEFNLDSPLCILHSCDVRLCVNPSHLFVGDRNDNNKDKVLKGRQSRGIKHRRVTGSKKRSEKTSKFIGVCWHKQDKKWRASIQIEGKIKHLGSFFYEEEAAKAYQNALNNLYVEGVKS